MALKTAVLPALQRVQRSLSSLHRNYNATRVVYNKNLSSEEERKPSGDVPGLSDKIIECCEGPVGPGASKTSQYKNPEYFCYNTMSYHEAEIEMAKYRCPQPSNKKNN